MTIKNLNDLFVEQIRELYDAESRVMETLPRMAQAASSLELRGAIEEHEEVTRKQRERLEDVFRAIELQPELGRSWGIEGIIKEGEQLFREDIEPEARDAALVATLQRVEHYEIAGYGTASSYAEALGLEEPGRLLRQSLEDEKRTDRRFSDMAVRKLNIRARK